MPPAAAGFPVGFYGDAAVVFRRIAGGEFRVCLQRHPRHNIPQPRVGDAAIGKGGGVDRPVLQRRRHQKGDAVVGGFAGLGVPLFRLAGGGAGGHLVGVDVDGTDVGNRRRLPQLQRQADGGLGVNLRGVALEDSAGYPKGVVGAALAAQRKIGNVHRAAGRLFPQAAPPLERLKGAGHSGGGQRCSEHRRAGGAGGGASFPHRQLAGAGDAQRQLRGDGQGNGVAHLLLVQPQQPPGAADRPDDAEHPLIPA